MIPPTFLNVQRASRQCVPDSSFRFECCSTTRLGYVWNRVVQVLKFVDGIIDRLKACNVEYGEDSGRLRRRSRSASGEPSLPTASLAWPLAVCNKSFGLNQFQIIYAGRPRLGASRMQPSRRRFRRMNPLLMTLLPLCYRTISFTVSLIRLVLFIPRTKYLHETG